MRINGNLYKGLVLALVLTLFPSIAFSAQKITPGATCKVLKQKVTYQKKIYTCTKSGKKLVWSKGVSLVNPTPTPSPTPKPSPTPTPSLTPSPTPTATSLPVAMPKDGDSPLQLTGCYTGNYFYRLNNGVLERSFFENKLFTATDTRPNSEFDPIRLKAYQTIRSHVSSTSTLPTVDFHISTNFPKVKLAYSKDQLASTLQYWSDFVPAGSHFQATFITEKDSALISADDISRPDDAQWIIDTFLDSNQAGYLNCGWRYGVSGSHILGRASKNFGQIGYWMISPTLHGDRFWDPTYLTHEVTHGIQDIIWTKNDISPMEQAGAPYFLIEGGGYLFGIGLSLTNIGWYQDDLNRKIYE
jgi:hypothetical protein